MTPTSATSIAFDLSPPPTMAGESEWSPWIACPLAMYEVPGDHYTLLREPRVAGLAEKLANHLNALEQEEEDAA